MNYVLIHVLYCANLILTPQQEYMCQYKVAVCQHLINSLSPICASKLIGPQDSDKQLEICVLAKYPIRPRIKC